VIYGIDFSFSEVCLLVKMGERTFPIGQIESFIFLRSSTKGNLVD